MGIAAIEESELLRFAPDRGGTVLDLPTTSLLRQELSALRSAGAMDLSAELDRVRLESDALYGVIAVVSSSPDLSAVLRGVVALTTRAANCHASFVYLRTGNTLELRAASGDYERLVGRIRFGVDEGLTGWALRNNEAAFLREGAMDDPRNIFVPELEEERFQSLVAVPIPSRSGAPIGVLVLHTVAPREFDDGTVNILTHTASLVAGAIENAQLYEAERTRVNELQLLSQLSQRIAGVSDRSELYATATSGLHGILRCQSVAFYATDEDSADLELTAASPSMDDVSHPSPADVTLLSELARGGELANTISSQAWSAAVGHGGSATVAAARVAAGGDQFGVLVVTGERPITADVEWLLRAAAGQLAIALQKVLLIERLTDENATRDLVRALEAGDVSTAGTRAARAGVDLGRSYRILHVLPSRGQTSWDESAAKTEAGLRRIAPRVLCHVGADEIWAILPTAPDHSPEDLARVLNALGVSHATAIGVSDACGSALAGTDGLEQARCASRVTVGISPGGGSLAFGQLGAYRYLVAVAEAPGPPGRLDQAVEALMAYDRRRRAELVLTLERYLAEGRNVTRTAQALTIHPNTLRQRIERIESLTDLRLKTEDLLAVELAVKLARLRGTAPEDRLTLRETSRHE